MEQSLTDAALFSRYRTIPTKRIKMMTVTESSLHHATNPSHSTRVGPPTHAWMLHDWLTVDLNEMLPAADLNLIISETE